MGFWTSCAYFGIVSRQRDHFRGSGETERVVDFADGKSRERTQSLFEQQLTPLRVGKPKLQVPNNVSRMARPKMPRIIGLTSFIAWPSAPSKACRSAHFAVAQGMENAMPPAIGCTR